MRHTNALALSVLVLWGCSPDRDSPVATPLSGARIPSDVNTNAGAASAPSRPTADSYPSYEVSIASAGADRVHALETCDAQPKPERAECKAKADAAFNKAKADADANHEAGL
jgi:hypothetical protein